MKVNIINKEKSYPINYGDIFVRSQDHEAKVYMLCEIPIDTSKESKEMNCHFVRVSDDKSHAYNVGLVLKEVAKLTAQN